MSAFEVTCTPPRVVAKKTPEAREPTLVLLGPFTPKATVVFDGVPVGKTARRLIIVRNTNKSIVQVTLTRVPDPECGISFEWLSAEVEAGAERTLEVVWNPQQLILGKEVVSITDSIGNKKDVQFVLKTVELKAVGRKSTVKSFTVPKKLKLKSPSPPKVKLKRNVLPKKTKASPARKGWSSTVPKLTLSSTMGSITSRVTTTILGPSNRADVDEEYSSDFFDDFSTSPVCRERNKMDKENIIPISPLPVSIQQPSTKPLLTPITNNDSYFSNIGDLPTPECYIKCIGRQTLLDGTARKKSEISPKIRNHLAPMMHGKHPISRMTTGTNVSTSTNSNKLELTATPPERTMFDPCSFSTVTKSTTVDKTYLKPNTESPTASESILDHQRSGENIQRLLTFSPETFSNKIEEQEQSNDGKKKHEGTTSNSIRIVCTNPEGNIHLEEQHVVINNKTQTLEYDASPHLSIITEEHTPELGITFERPVAHRNGSVPDVMNLVSSLHKHQTFIVTSEECIRSLSVENIAKNTTVTIDRSIRDSDSCSSLPNLLNNSVTTGELDRDELDKFFKEHEIRAQSSRFNLHEVGRFSDEMQTPIIGCKRGHDAGEEKPMVFEQEFSPPKRRCRYTSSSRTTDTQLLTKSGNESVSRSFRKPIGFKTNQDRSVQTSSSRNLSLKRPARTSALSAKCEEKRVFLYDSDRHLKTLINPDPFAATTTCNPFLSVTMYLDERAFEQYERQMKKWLNALVTIPADLDTEPNKPLDVGKLFDEVKSKELTLAPTKELISSNYYKNRLNNLRSAGIALYMSEEVSIPLRKIAAQIEKQLLTLRTDRSLHLDLVLQRTVLELLLCFNPLWLRLGLEVVFGEQIELQSNRDIVGLSTFIIHRLFRDRYLEARNSRAYSLSRSYAEHMKKFTLRMVLFLLFFLDTAKRRRLIKHNPCLFVRNAPHKETREILVRFSSTLVAGIGDITKHLKRVGYTLSHKQSFLDEYHYAFENLAVDLRDGVRLTRVMEIILLRDDLSASLRVPPISRLQKIHNINLALGALEQAEYRIAGDITAKDICDGHREQTMSLLWQIVYKFRAPKFNAAATVLQRWWRSNWLKVAISRRIDRKRQMRREAAARTIQAAVRGYCVRVWYEAIRRQKLRAIITIQRFARRYLAQKVAARRFSAIVRIQHWWRSVHRMRAARERFLLARKSAIVLQTSYRRYALGRRLQAAAIVISAIRAEARHRYQQATVIQRCIKSYVIHRRLHAIVNGMVVFIRRTALRNRSATKIQAYQRMRTVRAEFLRTRSATVCIQRRWRECLLARHLRTRYVLMRTSAIRVQQHYRGWLQMREDVVQYHQTRDTIVRLQRRWRAVISMRNERTSYGILRSVTINVQRRFRARKAMQIEMHRYKTLRCTTVAMQRRYRANRTMLNQRREYDVLRAATLRIQSQFRAQLSMREARESYVRFRQAVVVMQLRYRAKVLMQQERARFLHLRRCTLIVQARFRAIHSGRAQRQMYLSTRTAALKIQCRWRAVLEMRRVRGEYHKERNASIILQRAWRGIMLKRKIRNDYLRYRAAATILQQRYRALCMGRSVRREFARKYQAAITIQRKLRATLRMHRERQAFVRLRQTTILLQCRFRANRAARIQRTRYADMKRSAVRLCAWWAGELAMRRERAAFLRQKSAAIVIQRRYRALRAMRMQAAQYKHVRDTVLFIQRKYRAHRAMERCRGRFLNLRSASVIVQEFYRGHRQRQKDRAAFLRLREAALVLQRRFRANRLMRVAVNEYGRKKAATLSIQRWFRGYLAMREVRNRFRVVKHAALVIQAHYRAHRSMLCEMERYDRLRRAVRTIEIRWAATLQMRRERVAYQRTIVAIRIVQIHYRAYRERLIDESNYRIYRSAVIVVQRRYRDKLATRAERQRFVQIRRTANGLQAHARGLLARRAFRAMLTPEYLEGKRREKATLCIQAWWRGVRHRKRYQTAAMRTIVRQMVVSRREAQRDPTIRLNNVSRLCMRFLKSRFNSSEAIGILYRLERMSRLVPHLLVGDAVFLAVFCYRTMAQAIRSEVDKILIEICARIILNLARFPGTKEQAFQENGLVTVSQMLLRWCDKDCAIFSTLCTLLWVLAHDYKKKNAIRRYMISKDAIFMLRETKKLVQRKEKMRKNVQRPVGCLVAPNPLLMCTVPSLEPDFGVNRSKPYVFYSSVFGFQRVLQVLEVDLS